MFDDLKDCPFCGIKAYLFVSDGVKVTCPKCGAQTKILVDGMYGDKPTGNAVGAVIDAWNKRVSRENDHGYWVKTGGFSTGSFMPVYKCSVCEYMQDMSSRLKYCPDCGARMDGEEK